MKIDADDVAVSPVPPDLLKVDLDASTMKLGERWFPAVGLVTPVGPQDPPDEPPGERLLGGPTRIPNQVGLTWGGEVYVPCENGLLVEIGWGERDRKCVGLYVHLYNRHCELRMPDNPADLPIWIPKRMHLHERRLIIDQPPWRSGRGWVLTPGLWEWGPAEPEWVAELLDRLSRLPLEETDGPQADLVRLAEVWEMVGERPTARAEP